MPYWVTKPSGLGYIGGVGYCGVHINGKAGQRELAVSRAVDEIARQLSIQVSTVTSSQTSGTDSSYFSIMNIYSIQTVTGASFSAIITDVWEDGSKGELYVYMRLLVD